MSCANVRNATPIWMPSVSVSDVYSRSICTLLLNVCVCVWSSQILTSYVSNFVSSMRYNSSSVHIYTLMVNSDPACGPSCPASNVSSLELLNCYLLYYSLQWSANEHNLFVCVLKLSKLSPFCNWFFSNNYLYIDKISNLSLWKQQSI